MLLGAVRRGRAPGKGGTLLERLESLGEIGYLERALGKANE